MKKILKKQFFNRDAVEVARDLLGKYLVCDVGGVIQSLMVNEVEAYDGFHDRASHAHKGMTKRNEVMFGHAGYWYVYLCYGMYWMLNIVTGEKDYPAAILIRGAGEFNGPGKLTRFLKVDKRFDGMKSGKKTGLWFEDRGTTIVKEQIKTSPRIGVNYAGKEWAGKHYRFLLT